MTNFLYDALSFWVDLGLYDVFLPFIFIYTIVYAVLKQTEILGKQNNVNSMVAFCMGFIVTASLQTVTTIQTFFSTVGFIVVFGLSVMIIIGMFGLKSINTGNNWYNKLPRNIIMIVIAIGFFYILSIGLGFNEFIMNLIPSFPNIVTQTIIVGAVFVIIIWYIVGAGLPSLGSKTTKIEKSDAKKTSDGNEPKSSASIKSDPIFEKDLGSSGSFDERLKK